MVDQYVPADASRPISRLMRPVKYFFHLKVAGGILLFLNSVLAMIWANSAWHESYHDLWHAPFSIRLGDFALSYPLEYWINDGLMVIFFFVIGLEIKREILVGELRSMKKALLPIVAALGGVVVPAGLYLAVNQGGPGESGWGIPMATDIAFALGMLAILGRRAPVSLTIFLTALAIADDLAAVLVIAIFYTAKLSVTSLLAGFGLLGLMMVANRLWVRSPIVYALLGVAVWLAFLKSGVHATIAGVLAAFCIPARMLVEPDTFLSAGRQLLDRFDRLTKAMPSLPEAASRWRGRTGIFQNQHQIETIESLEKVCEYSQTPLQRMERGLHLWVTILILPLFALANAGVEVIGDPTEMLLTPVTMGVVLGLVLGKPVGIFLFSWIAVKLGWCVLPAGARWKHILAVGCLAGIGFTMSLFITGLAFTDRTLTNEAKLGILVASMIAVILGGIALQLAGRKDKAVCAPDLEEEAEA
jgi:Na+:H+ antiporter, NhaA family